MKTVAAPGEFLELDGYRLHWLEQPAAPGNENTPPVLLVHGKGGGVSNFILADWWEEVRSVPWRPRLLVLDRPAHGHTEGDPARVCGVEEQARLLWRFLDAHHIGPVHLVGHSVGGLLSLLMMRQQPERVRRALLLAPVGRPMFLFWLLHAGVYEGPVGGALAEASRVFSWQFVTTVQRQPWWPNLDCIPSDYRGWLASAFTRQNFRTDMQNMASIQEVLRQLPKDLADLRTPVEIITGTSDRVVPPGHSRFLAHQLPQAQLQELPRIGHMVPIAASTVVREALQRLVS